MNPAPTPEQRQTERRLWQLGWYMTHHYNDGILRMELAGTDISVFVRTDGSVTPPASEACHRARMIIHARAIDIRL